MKLAWATDIHLDHATNTVQHKFYEAVKDQADALVLTGDIAESPSIGRFLTVMEMVVERPVYFVLGNHDYYRGSIAGTRFYVAQVVGESRKLVYLSQAGVVELTPNTALAGHDGWPPSAANARLPLLKQARSLDNRWQSVSEGPPLFDRNWLDLKARNAMQAQTVRINLKYDRADLKQILRYAKAHDVERNGRYDFRKPPRLNVWTHAWSNTGCREESCVMFSLEFDWKTSALMSVVLMPGFDWEAFVDELATLEKAALGRSVYGKCRREPTT